MLAVESFFQGSDIRSNAFSFFLSFFPAKELDVGEKVRKSCKEKAT